MSKPGFVLLLNIRDLQLYRVLILKYVQKVFGVRYEIENYMMTRSNTRAKIKL